MHSLYDAIPVLYVPELVTRGALVAHRYTFASHESCSTTGFLFPSQCPCGTNFADPLFDGVGLAGFKNRASAFYWPKLLAQFFVFYCFSYPFFLSIDWYCGPMVFRLLGVNRFLPALLI